MARSLLAFFAIRFYDKRKEHFNLLAEWKKKKKITEEEVILEPKRVHARHLELRQRANPMRHFNHRTFNSLFLKP